MKRPGIPAERERASSRLESASTTDQHQSVTGPAETEHSVASVHWCMLCPPGGGLGTVTVGGWGLGRRDGRTVHEAVFLPR